MLCISSANAEIPILVKNKVDWAVKENEMDRGKEQKDRGFEYDEEQFLVLRSSISWFPTLVHFIFFITPVNLNFNQDIYGFLRSPNQYTT
jgi:hypothetical protein